MKKLLILSFAILPFTFSSCEEENDQEVLNIGYSQPVLNFLSFYPVEARTGDEIILSVSNYDIRDLATHISIGNHIVEYISIDEATIRAKIPQGIPQGHHEITIRSNGHTVTHENRILIFGSRF